MRFTVLVRLGQLATIFCLATAIFRVAQSEDFSLHTFERQQLTDVYYSEGIAAGDLNRDGHVDIVYGPYWFAGPEFAEKHEIYPAKPQPRERYADHFFAWVYDFNGDGWNDVLTAGFPGTPAFVYENPRAEGHGQAVAQAPGPRLGRQRVAAVHRTSSATSGRSSSARTTASSAMPRSTQRRPFEAWQFHPISEKVAPRAVRPRPGRRRRQRRRPARHPDEGRLVRAAGRARRRRPLGLPPGTSSPPPAAPRCTPTTSTATATTT